MSNSYKVPHFCCHVFANNGLHNNSFDASQSEYFRQNQLKWLLEKNNNYCNYWSDCQTICLFETNFQIDYNYLTPKQISVLFTFVKKYINELRSAAINRSDCHRNVYNFDYSTLRDKICTFLALLKRRLYEININCSSNEIKDQLMTSCVMREMKSLLLFVGRLSQLKPQLVSLSLSYGPETGIYNYFHCHLDIWWTSIELTFIVTQNSTLNLSDFTLVKEEILHHLCSQVINLVLYDLIALSVNRFNDTENIYQYLSLSPFMCSCVKEMFIMIKHLISAINSDSSNNKFWEQIFSTLNLFTNPDPTNSVSINDFKKISLANFAIKRSSLHFIWFTTSIATVFTYDINGQFDERLDAGLMPPVLLKFITQILKENEVSINEQELSCIIMLCLKTSKYWKPNSDLLLPFTEFFLKKLNNRFIVSNSIEEHIIIPESSAKWIEIIEYISSLSGNPYRKENSFKLYLSLVSSQLARIFEYCEPKSRAFNWNKFKGKVIVNLQPKKLEKINETGVINLFSFYLILINSSPDIWNEMIDKILDMINELLKQSNTNNLELILKFTFAALRMKHNSISDTKLICFIVKQFNTLCDERIRNCRSEIFAKSFANIIKSYFNELESIIRLNQMSKLPFDKLLNFNFSQFSCNRIQANEKSIVINFVNYLLTHMNKTMESRSHQTEAYFLVIKACFEIILPFVKKEITSKSYSKTLAEIAFSFTLLTNSMYQINQSEELRLLLNEFLMLSRKSENSDQEFTCHYLSLILRDQRAIQSLKIDLSQIKPTLISVWCQLLVSQEDDNLIDSLSINLSKIINDLQFSGTAQQTTKSLDIFTSFVRNLSENSSKIASNDQKLLKQTARQYFLDMVLTSESMINQDPFSLSMISRIYELMSHLVLIASQLLWVSGDVECLLAKIASSIIVPTRLRNSSRKHELIPIFHKAFPLFFEGLCNIPYHQFIERHMRDMGYFYLSLFIDRQKAYHYIKSSFVKQNIYKHWCKVLLQSKVILAILSGKTDLKMICDLIRFLNDFCNYELSNDDNLFEIIEAVLNKMILTTDVKLQEIYKEFIRARIKNVTNFEQQNHKVLVDRVFSSFIEKHLPNRSLVTRLFHILKFLSECCPQMLHDLIGEITRNIESIEDNKGLGNDLILRKALINFANGIVIE